uniref:Lipoprotein-attachment site-containing protein n=1 Tax=Candidatus Kentrum sp. FM TaxID=2126340 RepID=A0A450S802_9GAMM|nr:MAG: hypothetical protein BECKFM1743C_GA0114222_100528 [Candidatus Kentron sp. FM]VFJ60721.1 MAG: hypothetical protein BECKFM1743A_GA0114220_102703 [Candidatus Kentron sp. FM]VFK07920.1 MAG: hypothetical protein BECKFM1743B_GA0114221_100538 [Candidatus Kentron sp. FM]
MKAVRKKIYRLPWLIAMVLVVGLQAGCGQKGSLYLPDEEEGNSHSWKPGAVSHLPLAGKARRSLPHGDSVYYTPPGWRGWES